MGSPFGWHLVNKAMQVRRVETRAYLSPKRPPAPRWTAFKGTGNVPQCMTERSTFWPVRWRRNSFSLCGRDAEKIVTPG